MWLNLVAVFIMTVTDRILERTRPAGVKTEEWRAQVKAKMDAEDDWLVGEIKKHDD